MRRFLVGFACVGVSGTVLGCKPKASTASPSPKEESKAPDSQVKDPDVAAGLREQLSREALDELRPFDFELGQLKGRAFLQQAPEVEALDSGAWTIVGEYAPDGSVMECLLEPEITSLGEKMTRFIGVSLDASDKISDYQTSVGKLFLRQSKYAGLSQVLVYKMKEDPTVVGFYTLVSTHGESWTLTCAADSPGFFETLFAATEKLADSIQIESGQQARLPSEYSIYEIKIRGKRIALHENYLYQTDGGASTELEQVSLVSGTPNKNFKVQSQFHVRSFQDGQLNAAWAGSHVNGATESEFSFQSESGGKSVRVKDLKSADKAERKVKLEALILNQAQTKACVRDVWAGKKTQCKVSSASLTGAELTFPVATIRVKDKKARSFASSSSDVVGVQWFDESFDTTRSELEILSGAQKVPMESVRVWPPVEAE